MPARALVLTAILAACVSSLLTLVGALLVLAPTIRAAPDPQAVQPLVRAERFELVTPAGEVRAMLIVHPTGGGALYLRDAEGSDAGVDLSATAGGAGIVLRDTTGRVRTGLNSGGMPGLFLTDEAGQTIWQAP